ncbi:unnamed protein product, partial [Symbiodinium sp. KB8]
VEQEELLSRLSQEVPALERPAQEPPPMQQLPVPPAQDSSRNDPRLISLRRQIDDRVAAQRPLRKKANEMLRSLHHHRAMIEAARRGVEESQPDAQEVEDGVLQAQGLAELRYAYSQTELVHAHCIAENLDLKEKLRAAKQRCADLSTDVAHARECWQAVVAAQKTTGVPAPAQTAVGSARPPPGLESPGEKPAKEELGSPDLAPGKGDEPCKPKGLPADVVEPPP